MKKITSLLFILLATPFYGQWVMQNSGVTEILHDVYCLTPTTVIVVGDAGTILKTTDGGENWVPKASGTISNLNNVHFVSQDNGYAVGSNGTFLKTVNAGDDWSVIDIGETSNLYGLSFLNDNTFFILTSGGIIKTTDGGLSFQAINTPGNNDVEHIQFLDEQTGYASCFENIYRTNDGGNTWSVISNGTYSNAILFFNADTGLVYTNGGIYKTIDGGNTLSWIGDISGGKISDLFALNENRIWEVTAFYILCNCSYFCIGKRDVIDSESQGVRNCNLTGQELPLNAVYFANENTGYLVGNYGAIFKNTTGTMEEMGIMEVDKMNAVTISPNPASAQTTISFSEKPAQPYAIEIVDSTGKKVFSKTYQMDDAITIQTSFFAKGVYLLTIAGIDKRQTQKLIVN